jgi:hypothetical protein
LIALEDLWKGVDGSASDPLPARPRLSDATLERLLGYPVFGRPAQAILAHKDHQSDFFVLSVFN